jgi:thiamine pyrophosphate-dependent acetolactate synthase large subunit-like protein
MNRKETMQIVAALRGDAALIVGPGVNSGLLYEACDRPASLYNMDMAYATPVGLGIALGRPRRKVLVVEGEGSFFAGSPALSTIWRMRPNNLTVVVTDNGVWGTGDGREPSATSYGTDLAALAVAAGWDGKHVHSCDQPAELRARLGAALEGNGPHFIVCKNDPAKDEYLTSSSGRPRPMRHVLDCAVLMRRDLNGE